MEEKARYAVGVDVGTDSVRTVLGKITNDGKVFVVGYGQAKTNGIRRGRVQDLTSPCESILKSVHDVEKMAGFSINGASVNINGTHIASTKIEGMITVDATERGVDSADVQRLKDMATAGKVQANRELVSLVPYEYILDGQGGIREPLGMKGTRLEIRANAISALTPDYDNVCSIFENETVNIGVNALTPSPVAAAEAVLNSRQKENGVGVVDIGASTTGLAIYDEGELQFVGVVPYGSNDITNDLATVLKTIPEVAEEIKRRFVTAKFGDNTRDVVIKRDRIDYTFSRTEVDEVVEARLDEIVDSLRRMLKASGYDRRLPEGLVLVGGGSKLRDIDAYVRDKVELAVRLGKINDVDGAVEEVKSPEYATAIGLMLFDGVTEPEIYADAPKAKSKKSNKKKSGEGFLSRILKNFS